MKRRIKLFSAVVSVCLACAMLVGVIAGCSPTPEEEVSPIKSVVALGFMDKEGPKVNGLALEYEVDMAGADISADTYSLKLFDSTSNMNLGNGKIGDITKWYISDKAELNESATQGSGSGKYVILEVYTDYLSTTEVNFSSSLVANVKQTKNITVASGEVLEGNGAEVTNATITEKVNELTGNVTKTTKLERSGFEMPELDLFKFYIDSDPNGYGKDGDGFHWDNCFDQCDGKYYNMSVAYALYVPEDWHEGGNYAMVTLENPAATAGTHPMVSVLQTRSPIYYATTGQEVVKEAHPELDGMIVVVPVVTQRVNDNGGTPAEYEAIVHLWDKIIEDYDVNPNYVYGSGQSVGGMILIETQRNRDNFFAGLLLYEDQWAQNYYVDTLFIRNMASQETAARQAEMHYPRTDSYITWDYHYDTQDNKIDVAGGHDPYNMYYLISDDNMLVMRSDVNGLSMDNWNEMSYLYTDLTGSADNALLQQSFALKTSAESTSATLASENTSIENFLNADRTGKRNINTITFTGEGGCGYSIRMYDATYEWLLSQSRQSETARAKLDINREFRVADNQIQTEERKLHFTDTDGNALYFVTAQQGAGTRFYNTGWYNLLTVADAVPGWLPEGMTLGQVEGATIEEATVINDGAAIAIKYSGDMKNLTVRLKGDEILGYNSDTPRTDIKIELDPFAFFTADNKAISCTIKNVYVNTSATTVSGRARGEGSGCYLIVEFETPLTSTPAKLIQRTTLHTDVYIASAYPWTYDIT